MGQGNTRRYNVMTRRVPFVDAGLPGGTRGTFAGCVPVTVLNGGVLLVAIGLVWLIVGWLFARRRRGRDTEVSAESD